MIFCNTRIAVDRVQSFLSQKGYACQSLHGDIAQSRRLKTIQQFKQGDFHLLVATDVAARGIHIDDLSLVINYDVPVEKDSYVHRIGRTGRAGNRGRAITLVTGEDIMSLYEIEEHIGALIDEAELPSRAVYDKNKDSAEIWVQANSQRSKLPRVGLEPNFKTTQNQRSRTMHTAEKAKLVYSATVPVPQQSTQTHVVNTKMKESQDSAAKKPFLLRILQRILGRAL
jgi:superfamily II DNA/RNA helicase